MLTGLGITPIIRLASPRVLPEITAHSRLISCSPAWPAGAAGLPGCTALRQLLPVDEPQARGLPVPPGSRAGRRPDRAAAPSEPELNGYFQLAKTEVSRDRCVSGRAARPPILGVACNPIWDTMTFADGEWQQFATQLRETIPRGAEIREASCQSRRKGQPCCGSCWEPSCGGSGIAAVSPHRKRRGRSADRSRRSAGSSSAGTRSARSTCSTC
jgi:hypothetical protein